MRITYAVLGLAALLIPRATAEKPPSWWVALHGPYLTAEELAQVDFPPAPPPVQLTATVSFSPQGAAALKALTGKQIPGVGMYQVVVCSPSGFPIPAGKVYQIATDHGIAPLAPQTAAALFKRTVSMNWRNIALMAGVDASIGIPVLGQAGLVSMSSKWIVSLLTGHVLFDSVQNQIRQNIPDPAPVLNSLLDPDSMISFAGACKSSSMVTVYHKNPTSGTFPLPE